MQDKLISNTMLEIKKIVLEKGLSQDELSKTIGVSPVTMSRWMKGKRSPSIMYVEHMVKVLGGKLQISYTRDIQAESEKYASAYEEGFKMGFIVGKRESEVKPND